MYLFVLSFLCCVIYHDCQWLCKLPRRQGWYTRTNLYFVWFFPRNTTNLCIHNIMYLSSFFLQIYTFFYLWKIDQFCSTQQIGNNIYLPTFLNKLACLLWCHQIKWYLLLALVPMMTRSLILSARYGFCFHCTAFTARYFNNKVKWNFVVIIHWIFHSFARSFIVLFFVQMREMYRQSTFLYNCCFDTVTQKNKDA